MLSSCSPHHAITRSRSLTTAIMATIFTGVAPFCHFTPPQHQQSRPLSSQHKKLYSGNSAQSHPFLTSKHAHIQKKSNALSMSTEPGSIDSSNSQSSKPNSPVFKKGDQIQVEVVQFGRLGASVDVIASSHKESDIIPEDAPALNEGLILQSEIQYFRQSRNNVDVIQGEVLPAYVEGIREEDGRLHVSLRPPGGKSKAQDVSVQIMDRALTRGGVLDLGDKSSPAEIAMEFPGVSKSVFKKAISALYKNGKVKKPDAHRVELA